MTPDLERLRHFALLVALILISYTAAGIELERDAKISVLSVPFIIRSPELLTLGLVLARAYAFVRFYYYGIMLNRSPHRHRKDLLHALHAKGGHGTYFGSVYFGPANYSTTSLLADRNDVEAQLKETIESFPKVWNIRPRGRVTGHQFLDQDGEVRTSYEAEITIPVRCKLAALFQDVDYAAPIWLNLFALALSLFKLLDR